MPLYPPPSGGTQTQIDDANAVAGDYVSRVKLTADTQYRLIAGLDGSSNPQILMGPGGSSAPNIRLYKNGGVLVLSDNNTGVAAQLLIQPEAASSASVSFYAGSGSSGSTLVSLISGSGGDSYLTERMTGDIYNRTSLWGDSTITGLLLGPGASAQDIHIYRSGTKTLIVDANGGGGALTTVDFKTTNFYVNGSPITASATQVAMLTASASSYLAEMREAGDSQLRILLGLDGSENPQLLFGPGGSTAPDLRLYRSDTSYLTIDDGAGGDATLNVIGTFLVNGSPVTGGAAAAGTGTESNAASSASDTTILASNSSRLGATIFNDSTQAVYVLLANATSSATVYTIKMAPGGYYEVPYTYTGVVKGIWVSANGYARVTEFTA